MVSSLVESVLKLNINNHHTMNIVCITLGKKHDELFKGAIDEYTERLNHSNKFEWKVVEGTIADGTILKSITPHDVVVVLHDTGRL